MKVSVLANSEKKIGKRKTLYNVEPERMTYSVKWVSYAPICHHQPQ